MGDIAPQRFPPGRVNLPLEIGDTRESARDGWTAHLPFADPISVADSVRDRIAPAALEKLLRTAERASRGEIECFGRWTANFGDPIDWHRNPLNGARWEATAPWRRALAAQEHVGDVKLSWEVARFPHAYHMARSAAFFPEAAPQLARALAAQIRDFITANPYGFGIHWASGQEVAFRLLAWLFTADTLLTRAGEASLSASCFARHCWPARRTSRRTWTMRGSLSTTTTSCPKRSRCLPSGRCCPMFPWLAGGATSAAASSTTNLDSSSIRTAHTFSNRTPTTASRCTTCCGRAPSPNRWATGHHRRGWPRWIVRSGFSSRNRTPATAGCRTTARTTAACRGSFRRATSATSGRFCRLRTCSFMATGCMNPGRGTRWRPGFSGPAALDEPLAPSPPHLDLLQPHRISRSARPDGERLRDVQMWIAARSVFADRHAAP